MAFLKTNPAVQYIANLTIKTKPACVDLKVNIQQKVAGFHFSKVNLVEKNQKRNQPKKNREPTFYLQSKSMEKQNR